MGTIFIISAFDIAWIVIVDFRNFSVSTFFTLLMNSQGILIQYATSYFPSIQNIFVFLCIQDKVWSVIKPFNFIFYY